METTGPNEAPSRSELTRLWTGVLLAPLAWLIDLQINYALAGWACENRNLWVLDIVSAVALVVALTAAFISWGSWRAVNDQHEGPKRERTKLMAVGGIANGGFFALLIIATAIPNVILRSCP